VIRPARRDRRRTLELDPLEQRTLLDARGWIVSIRADLPAEVVQRRLLARGLEVADDLGRSTLLLKPVSGANTAGTTARLRRMTGVRFLERDRGIARPAAVYPTEFGVATPWGLNNPSNTDIDAPEAWAFTTGRASTIVAVIDSGIDTSHPDLSGRIWTNPNEFANGRDDDGNGYVDDLNGWNFITNTNNVADDDGHGTQVSGIIAAAANGGGPAVGVDWNARIMPLKFIDSFGNGSIANAVKAIHYAVNQGARVINASWGTPDGSPALASAIRYANSRGVVFVTAAGNDALNGDVDPSYPASYRLPNLIAVAATNSAGRLAQFSSFGKRSVLVAAPGVRIRTTSPGGMYASISGTSMAAPFVSGVASLLVGQYPEWSASEVVRRITATTRPSRSLQGKVFSGGILNAGQALNPEFVSRWRVLRRLRSR
jgi:subtilisin family serine protease